MIYAVCNKIIHGTRNAALMANKKLTKQFLEWGAVMNPYNPCAWNVMKTVNQPIVVFHVDNLLMTHGCLQAITDFVKKLDEVCGKNDPLAVTRGKLHECLGMTIDFRTEGKCMFSQHDSIKKNGCHVQKTCDDLTVQH